MRIDDFKYFLMLDDSDDELFLTRAIFQLSYPAIPFRCEKDPSKAVTHLCSTVAAGTRSAEICVLLDIRMPHANGFELIYRLRNEISLHECCILMLSASRAVDDRANAAAIGADGFVNKPFKIINLERALAACEAPVRAA